MSNRNASRSPPDDSRSRSTMSRRGFLASLGGLAATGLTGCASNLGFRKCELAADLSDQDLIAHLNQNIDQINSWSSNNVTLKTPWYPSITGHIAVERPRNFRLQASAMSTDVADLGSNDDRFWFWVRNDEDPGILTARHDRLRVAQRQMPLPFEPDWLIEALGVIPLDENEIEVEKHPTHPKQCLFRRQRSAPDGSPVVLTSTVDKCHGVIVEHSLMDRGGNVIAHALMSEYERDKKTGPLLSHTVSLNWPKAKLSLRLRMGAIDVNPPSLSPELFAMPEIANCPVYDIGGETQQATHEGRAKV